MRLLVCLDETAFSRSIIPAARGLADAAGAEVELLTVVVTERHAGEPWSGQLAQPPDGQVAAAVEEARRRLQEAAGQFDPPASTTALWGQTPAAAITAHARSTRPDIIALATHSRGRLGETVLGSTARDVTGAGVAPVLLLHPVASEGIDPADIPVGIHAFTRDGDLVGVVMKVGDGLLTVRSDAGGERQVPVGGAGAITAGRLVLDLASGDLAPPTSWARGR